MAIPLADHDGDWIGEPYLDLWSLRTFRSLEFLLSLNSVIYDESLLLSESSNFASDSLSFPLLSTSEMTMYSNSSGPSSSTSMHIAQRRI